MADKLYGSKMKGSGYGAHKEYGESDPKYVGSGSDGYMKPMDSKGVESGLSAQQVTPVKDEEGVTRNQRPVGNMDMDGDYEIGVL